LLPEDGISIEHGPVHAHALHGRSLLGPDLDDAAGAAAHGAGHEFLQGNLTGQPELACQGGDCFEHGVGTAGANLDLGAGRRVQAFQPAPRQSRDIAPEAAQKAQQTREPTGYAPVVEQGHGGDYLRRQAWNQVLGRTRLEGKGDLGAEDGEGSEPPVRAQGIGQKDHGGDTYAAADEEGPRVLGMRLEGAADGSEQADALTGSLPGQEPGALPDHLVEEFYPVVPRARAHDRERPAHR